MGIVVIGAVFVDVKGYPEANFIPTGRNAGRVEHVHGGVGRNVAEDIANCELRPTFVSLVDHSGDGEDVIRKLKNHKVNTDYIWKTREPGWRFLIMTVMWPLLFPSVPICFPSWIFWTSMVMRFFPMQTVLFVKLTSTKTSSNVFSSLPRSMEKRFSRWLAT